jgi:hypothetical protein
MHLDECPKTDGSEGPRVLQVFEASQRYINEQGRKISLAQSPIPLQQSVSSEAAQSSFVHEEIQETGTS